MDREIIVKVWNDEQLGKVWVDVSVYPKFENFISGAWDRLEQELNDNLQQFYLQLFDNKTRKKVELTTKQIIQTYIDRGEFY